MTERGSLQERVVPVRALGLSLVALLTPVVGTIAFPEQRAEVEALLWLVALIPAFLLAYYRGWRGVATALAAGMALLSLTHLAVTMLDRDLPSLLFPTVVAYLAIGLGVGWVAELLHRQRNAIEDMALTDPLTGLPNRRHAKMFLDHEFGSAQRGQPLVVVLFDLDGFKQYNDTYGHPAGDEALKIFADILANTTRRMNLSARHGGEEFISILTGSAEAGARVFADRVREQVEQAAFPVGQLTVSAGLAGYRDAHKTPDDLIAAADLALYRAKEEGRNRVVVFDDGKTDIPDPGAPPAESEEESMVAVATRSENAVGGGGGGLVKQEAEATPLDDLVPEARETPIPPGDLAGPRDGAEPRSEGRGKLLGIGEDRRVLLVEDDVAVRSTLATYLCREGFAVVETTNVNEGLAALTREFDVVITDIRLPGPSGNDLVAALKSRWPETQAIVMTGHRDVEAAAEALNAGADRYLFKPFGIDELHSHLVEGLARRDLVIRSRLERQRLEDEAERRASEARGSVLRGARALVRAVEVRDPYTQGHSSRVAAYAVRLARELHPDVDIELDRLHLACELHDVGKIGVPDAILNKEGPLTPEEFERVRRHPTDGRTILELLLGDDLILSVTAWHHERWDGQGYPDGLAGEAIPFAARIVALVDTLDAMTSTRAYRSRLPWDEATAHILKQGGTQFDPGLIDPFRSALPALHQTFLEMSSLEGQSAL